MVVVLAFAGAWVGLVRVADAEVSSWRADRDEVRRLDRRPPSSVALPPAVTGVRPAPVPVLFDQDEDHDDGLRFDVGGPDRGAA